VQGSPQTKNIATTVLSATLFPQNDIIGQTFLSDTHSTSHCSRLLKFDKCQFFSSVQKIVDSLPGGLPNSARYVLSWVVGTGDLETGSKPCVHALPKSLARKSKLESKGLEENACT
jgi:hypothetical protein